MRYSPYILVLLGLFVPAAADEKAQSAPAIARLERLQSLKVEYTLVYRVLQHPTTEQAESEKKFKLLPYRDGRTSYDVFAYSPDSVRWSSDLSPEDVNYFQEHNVRPLTHHEVVFHDGIGETLNETPGRPSTGSLQGSQLRMPIGSVVDIGLGLRAGEGQTDGWLSAGSLASMVPSTDKEMRLVLRNINGFGQAVERTYDPKLGYAMVSYRRLYKGTPAPVTVILATDFRLVDGTPLPFHLEMTGCSPDGVGVTRYVATVKAYTLNAQSDKHLKYPKNTQVIDARTETHYRVERDNLQLTNEVLAKATNGGENDAVRVLRARAVLAPPMRHRGFPLTLAIIAGLAFMAGTVAIFWGRQGRSNS